MKIDKKAYEAAGFLEKFNSKEFLKRLKTYLNRWFERLKDGGNG
jgi:hypothetical protein